MHKRSKNLFHFLVLIAQVTLAIMYTTLSFGAANCPTINSYTIDLSNEYDVSNVPVGMPITGWISTGEQIAFVCDSSSSNFNASEEILVGSTGGKYGGFWIRETGYPGIGLIARAEGRVTSYGIWEFPGSSWKVNVPYGGANTFQYGYQVMLIRTGNVEPGVMSEFTLGNFFLHDFGNVGSQRYASFALKVPSTTILSDGTCTPLVTNHSVNLDIATFNSLQNVGDTAGSTFFNMDLDCDGNPNVAVRFDGIAAPDVSDNTVLSSSGTSTGVGIQISHNDAAIVIGENVTVLNDAPNGIVTIPFEAKYYRLPSDLSVGSVSSVATFTITYP